MSLSINKIQSKNNISFGSLNYPIAPFKVMTKKGEIFAEEILSTRPELITELRRAANFSVDAAQKVFAAFDKSWNFASDNDKLLEQLFSRDRYSKALKSADASILIGTDGNKDIKALFILQDLEEHLLKASDLGELQSKKIGLVQECMVDEEYRSQGLGKIFMDKLLQSIKPFSDIVLIANNAAVNFYARAGFKDTSNFNSVTNKLNQYLLTSLYKGCDYNNYTPMAKAAGNKSQLLL